MADTVINAAPSCLDCLSWSDECNLAVAAGETVVLLIPKIGVNRDPSDQTWETIHLRINEWTEQEIPVQELAPFPKFSVGAELSASNVTALEWSPQGLAKYRRCALAVLTQNLVLSLWSAGTNPRNSVDWSRDCLVNHELETYVKSLPKKVQTGNERSLVQIKAFAWSPPAYLHAQGLGWGENFIAVANASNEILILWVPADDHITSTKDASPLKSNALAHFSVEPTKNAKLSDPSWTFEDYLINDIAAVKVVWSPWFRWTDGSLLAIIAYATRTKMGFRQVNVKMTGKGPKVQVGDHEAAQLLPIPGAINGPLRWIPDVLKNNRMQLFASAGDTIIRYDLAAIGNIDIKRTHFVRPDWDPVSAFTFTKAGQGRQQLNFPPHISLSSGTIASLELASLKPRDKDDPTEWTKKIIQYRDFFSREKNRGDNVIVKVAGMATSPFGNLVATCFSMNAEKGLAYLIPSQHRSTISISKACAEEDADFLDLDKVSSEALAFILKASFKDPSLEAKASAITKLTEALKTFESLDAILVEQRQKTPELLQNPVTLMGQKVFRSKELKMAQLMHLSDLLISKWTDFVTRPTEQMLQPSKSPASSIPKLVTQKVLAFAESLQMDDSSAIRRLDTSEGVTSKEIFASYMTASRICGSPRADDVSTDDSLSGEICEMCGADIYMRSLTSAVCQEGHQFVRCALTFLAIQTPGISKSCGICGKPYLKNTYLDAEVTRSARANGHGNKLPSFAHTLFAACETCIYCGGKFVG